MLGIDAEKKALCVYFCNKFLLQVNIIVMPKLPFLSKIAHKAHTFCILYLF